MTSIRDFVTDFEKKHYKIKSYGITISDDLLGFRLLKSANLSPRDEQLVKATVSDLKYDEVKSKLTKIFSEEKILTNSDVEIKSEPVFHTQQTKQCEDLEFTDYNNYDDYQSLTDESQAADTFYNANFRPNQANYRGRFKPSYGPRNQANYNPSASSSNWRRTEPSPRKSFPNTKGKNPLDRDGLPTRCSFCQSINHWAPQCPDRPPLRNEHSTLLTENEIVLHQNNSNDPHELQSLVAETWSSALLDCGASKTVCGNEWFEQYKQILPPDTVNQISISPSSHVYRFGDGRKLTATKNALIPATIGDTQLTISTDIVDSDIPLLLSRSSMKKANMKLNFEDDTIAAFGNDIPLITTSSGHYAVPITKPVQIANKLERGSISNVTLSVIDVKTDKEIAIKLHRQFAHPTENRLLNLVNNAGHPWANNVNLKNEIKTISKDCETCKVYKKPPPRPVVGLPTATTFKETVAMDLKFYNGNILLHMIDHATRLSASSVIPNKKPETIVKHIFDHWLQPYGTVKSFLSDNGGEFINKPFMELCETCGINIKTTAAESPWSNGLVERHNLIISEMLDKVLADTSCNINIGIAWCCNAKNSLENNKGFSPYQLAIGSNPTLPSISSDKLPALTNEPTFDIIRQNLNALHKAREAFIQAENSSKIKRALSHNIRSSGDVKYINGDSVYYKRLNNHGWHGPAKVLGQDGQQVLVKHGGSYVRVHPCRLQIIDTNNQISSCESTEQLDQETTEKLTSATKPLTTTYEVESSDEDEPLTGNSNDAASDTSKTIPAPNSYRNDDPTLPLPMHTSNDVLSQIRPKMNIKFKTDSNDCNSATTVSRAGKATGKYPHWWNIQTHDGTTTAVDLSEVKDLEIFTSEAEYLGSEDHHIGPFSCENHIATLPSLFTP